MVPLLLAVLLGLLFGLLTWSILRSRNHNTGYNLEEARDPLIIGLLLLAALAMAVFLAYLGESHKLKRSKTALSGGLSG